jgi:cyclopropane-fatty-acyl-phospholipid synthase
LLIVPRRPTVVKGSRFHGAFTAQIWARHADAVADLAKICRQCYLRRVTGNVGPALVFAQGSAMNALSLLSSAPRQIRAARNILGEFAKVFDLPISVRLWDGSMVPLGRNVEPGLFLSISGPGVIGSLVRWPTLDNVMRHYAAAHLAFHGADLMRFGDIARPQQSRQRLKQVSKWSLIRNLLTFLCATAERADVAHAYAGETIGLMTPKRSNRDYVKFHYDDLGNDFYQLFLDPEMQYTCGYFTDWNNSLEQAQRDKLEITCRKLRLKPGERFLDIGCGWGGLLCYAAKHYGVKAHGVTISETQLEFARAKIRAEGLEDRITIELRDYNTLEGTFDKISAIGICEHVGIANFPAYFRKVYSLLRDRGIFLNQGITRRAKPPKKFNKVRPTQRLIAKYIFPGGELDHIGHTIATLEEGRFEVHDVEDWREHYALTCRHWCQRLSARKDEAIAKVGPERYRLWVAYLAGCSFGFADGTIRIYQTVASKHSAKGLAELPPTRADLYGRAG